MHVTGGDSEVKSNVIFTAIATISLSIYSTPSMACRVRFVDALKKSTEATYAYFDHAVLINTTKIGDARFVNQTDNGIVIFAKLKIVKSYKGSLPNDLFIFNGSDATCGFVLKEGKKYLAFFNADKFDKSITEDSNLPVFNTTLINFGNSKLIEVADEAALDEIIEKAKNH